MRLLVVKKWSPKRRPSLPSTDVRHLSSAARWIVILPSVGTAWTGQPQCVCFMVMNSYCKVWALNPSVIFIFFFGNSLIHPLTRTVWDHQICAFNCQAGHQTSDVIRCRGFHPIRSWCISRPDLKFVSHGTLNSTSLSSPERVVYNCWECSETGENKLILFFLFVCLLFFSPQCITYVVHKLTSSEKGQSIEWRRKHAETAYTVITLNLFIGHFLYFSVCVRFAVTLINGTTGIDNDACQFWWLFGEKTREMCKYGRWSSYWFTIVTVCFCFEGRRREGTIQDFSMIHRYFSTNLNQMILYTVE